MTAPPDRLLRRLEWQVVRPVSGLLHGAHRTVLRGNGIDFTGLREYVAEDDVRHIDWNVTARLDQPHVRLYTEDRDLTAWLVLDKTASMSFGSGATGKDARLIELAISLARLLTMQGNRVGAILYDSSLRQVIPARTGRNHVLYVASEVSKPSANRPSGTGTDLGAMLALAASSARRRALVFVISDFIADSDWEAELSRLGMRHEVVALRLVAPMELDLPDLGLVLAEDAETGEQILVDTSDPLFRQRLADEVAAREAAVATSLRRSGVTSHVISTDADLIPTLVEVVRRARRRRR
jgi:uncharacterized protein (DUF58 family)